MPITTSAKKEVRKGARRAGYNRLRKKAMRGNIKTIKQALVSKDVATAEDTLSSAYKAIDKAVKRGVIKKNTAARKKSRLVAAIKRTKAAV